MKVEVFPLFWFVNHLEIGTEIENRLPGKMARRHGLCDISLVNEVWVSFNLLFFPGISETCQTLQHNLYDKAPTVWLLYESTVLDI